MKHILPLILLVAACGGAVQKQGRSLQVTRAGLDATADALELVCDPARVIAQEDPETVRTRCLRAIEGHDTSRAAWRIWRDAFLVAVAEDDSDALEKAWAFMGPILEFYGETREFLIEFDVTLPQIPGAH